MILNLDKLVPEDKKVTLNGTVWILPGDIPVSHMLKLMNAQIKLESNPGNPDGINSTLAALHDIFSIRSQKLTLEKFCSMISIKQIEPLVKFIFDVKDEVEKKTVE